MNAEDLRRELTKIDDTVGTALRFHTRRDEMNAAVHLADKVRLSPLTSELSIAHEALGQLIKDLA